MEIVAHTMEYCGANLTSQLEVRHYVSEDYDDYKRIYEDCFFAMRAALGLSPVNCCDSQEELLLKQDQVFIYEIDGTIVGSVAVYDNEIDDLIVAKEFQNKGYGKALLQFAIAFLQKHERSPIILHVADWNQGAIIMYLSNGFKIVKTETVR